MGGPRENPELRGFVRGAREVIEAEWFVPSGRDERARIADRTRRARSVRNDARRDSLLKCHRSSYDQSMHVSSRRRRRGLLLRIATEMGFVGFVCDVAVNCVRERVRTESYGDERIAEVCRRSWECGETNSDVRDELVCEDAAS